MPFPYAYYKEEYTGPLHGESVETPALFIKHSILTSYSGTIDVTNKSHISMDTASGNVVVSDLVGGKDGQVLVINKPSAANSLTIQNNSGSNQIVKSSSGEDIVIPVNKFGGTTLVCKEEGGNKVWYQHEGLGVMPDGLSTAPGLVFGKDADTGVFRKADNVMGVAAGGLERLEIGLNGLSSKAAHKFSDGNLNAPGVSFSSNPAIGIYRTSGKLGFANGGSPGLAMKSNGAFENELGYYDSSNPHAFLDGASGAQAVQAGSLLASSAYTDQSLVPTNGIYSQGHVKTGGEFQGTATSAKYADLAERYEADSKIEPGTIVQIGGEKEITKATDDVFGVISTKPALKLNSEAGTDDTHPYVALAGRVPCRVQGKVKKGDRISIGETAGVGISIGKRIIGNPLVVGISLEDKEDEAESLIEITTGGIK